MEARDGVLKTIQDRISDILTKLISVDDGNFVGAYTNCYNDLIDTTIQSQWFDSLSETGKSYAIVYLNYRYSQLVLESVLGGNLDDRESVVELRKKLENVDEKVEEVNRPIVVELIEELNTIGTELAPIGISRRIKLLHVEGIEAYKQCFKA